MKKEDVELVKNQFNPVVCTVLEALYIGLEVKLKDYTLALAKTNDNNEALIIILNKEEDIIGADRLSVNELISLSNSLTDEEKTILLSNIALNKDKNRTTNQRGV